MGNRGGKGGPFQRQGPAFAAQAQGNGERVVRCRQVIAHGAVQRGQHGIAFDRRARLLQHGYEGSEHGIDAATHQAGDREDTVVNQIRNGAGSRRRWGTGDVVVHLLDQAGQVRGAVNRQPAEAEKVGGMNTRFGQGALLT